MKNMTFIRLAVACALLCAGAVAPAQSPSNSPLRVIRTIPMARAAPTTEISVTFDRPVAGSLDRTVDPRTILTVEPAVAGQLEWRDPVTIRLKPAAPLTPGMTYKVTVGNSFRAVDGSALAEPYVFEVRVRSATLLAGQPVDPSWGNASMLSSDQTFRVVYSAEVDLTRLASTAYLEFNPVCAGPDRIIHLRATGQRPVDKSDPGYFRRAGFPDTSIVSRVISLAPEHPMPRDCGGLLVLPKEADEQLSQGYAHWQFKTHGDFRIQKLDCGGGEFCPSGPLVISFTTPVRGSDVQRHVHTLPEMKFTISDTERVSQTWEIEAPFKPRMTVGVVVDTSTRDMFGQPLLGNPAAAFRTTGVEPSIVQPVGTLVVERVGPHSLAIQHANIDTLLFTVAAVPDSLLPQALSRFGFSKDSLWAKVKSASVRRIAVRNPLDKALVTPVALPVPDARVADAPVLYAVQVTGRSIREPFRGAHPTTLVQITDLGVHARIGTKEGAVWVTGVSDGKPKAGVSIVLKNGKGKTVAVTTTDDRGLAKITGLNPDEASPATGGGEEDEEGGGGSPIEGYVIATLGADRAVTAINQWDPDLSPWRFGANDAYGDERFPLAGALFTERGIYRPGETVHAKAIVRDGSLGALAAPATGDSIKWIFHARDEGTLREATGRLSAFGTSSDSIRLPSSAPIGYYSIDVQVRRFGKWRRAGWTGYRVAEYRPPEFLVDLGMSNETRHPGDTISGSVQARYLFGAPMGRAEFRWEARRQPMSSWELTIPNFEGWYLGDADFWGASEDETQVFANGTDTLDARGEKTLKVQLPDAKTGRPIRVTLEAAVSDINRQIVGSSATTVVHPADFYIAARPTGKNYFWTAGQPQTIELATVRPNGEVVAGVSVEGTLVRREWHSVRRERDGVPELVGEWVTDTVGSCSAVTSAARVTCTVTPTAGGIYMAQFRAKDSQGRSASTRFSRWATGTEWVPWNDESQFKMDVVADRARYSVGDTATMLFASPFTGAEAWVTVEREGIILQRRLKLTSGSTTLKLPITEAFAPNAFVSIIVARGRSADPGPLDDPGRPTIRVGYASLRVTPEYKRLSVSVTPTKSEYRPGDTARVRLTVRDARGAGHRSEVTLWAVDEGVLALTAFKTPDPLDLIYRERGLGVRLRSNLTAVAPQVPEGEKGKREPGGGGGAAGSDVLRSRFQTTAFFLASVVTDAQGNATATAKLPDNLTTFRVMAVAVTSGDRFGDGEAKLLVTRPLLARQALPRFVRPGDDFIAGAVINRRDGAALPVNVRASATGVTLKAAATQSATLAPSKGVEVRFPFAALRGDSAAFRFDVNGTTVPDSDAVRVAIPVRPDFHPRSITVSGLMRDTSTAELSLPADIDPTRSTLTVSVGTTPLAMIKGYSEWLRVYPYYCSEQVISSAIPLIALYRADRQGRTGFAPASAKGDIARAVEMLTRRQREDGGIGYWSPSDWTTAWLSAYAGIVLLDARDAGFEVDPAVLSRLSHFISEDLHGASVGVMSPVASWYVPREIRLRDQVAAVDFLSRFGTPDVPAENELLRQVGLLSTEDHARLAEVLMRRQQTAAARALMMPLWNAVQVNGRRAMLPDSDGTPFYFRSHVRPLARVLMATLAIQPDHPLVGPLMESIAMEGRASARSWLWNTDDYGFAAAALAMADQTLGRQTGRFVRVRSGNRIVLQSASVDSSVTLAALQQSSSGQTLRLNLDADPGPGMVFYYLTVNDIPKAPPVTPEDQGIKVERWYERYGDATPTTSATEGDLVRVRLRLTVTSVSEFVVLDDALPAGLEAVDLSLRTSSALPGPGANLPTERVREDREAGPSGSMWYYGSWDSGWWSPFDHRELRDDRVVYSATILWPGSYTATYLARATTPGTFIRPPAHAEEMYNPGMNGRSDGGTFIVRPKGK